MNDKRRKNGNLGKTILIWVKRALGAAFVLGVVAMLVMAWMPKPIPVDVAEVESGSLLVTVDESGRTRVKDRYIVSAPLAGNVARMALDPGDSVEEGQELAQILSLEPPLMDARSRAQAQARVSASRAAARQARATRSRIEASSQFAERESERQRGLAARGSVASLAAERAELAHRTSREELSSATFATRVADYELRVAEAALRRQGTTARRGQAATEEQVVVEAPVAGKVLRVIQESEGVVQAGSPLLELGDASHLEIVVDVLTSDAVHVALGAAVIIERWGGDEVLHGRVRIVEPSAFTRVSALGVEEQRVNVIIDIDEPYEVWQALGDGYRVEARIVTWEGQDVLKVPSSSVFRRDDGWAVYVVGGEEIVALRSVEVGERNGLEVQITSGLDAGDQVVLHPSDQITEGVQIEVR